MATTTVPLTRNWTLIADGTQWVTVSLSSGGVVLMESANTPAADANGHTLVNNANITPPSRVYARATGVNAEIIRS